MGYTILGDVHTHTLYSRHAYSTIEENVRAAAEAGLEILGSADHFSGMLYPEQHLRNFQYLINMGVWPRTWHGVTVLHGWRGRRGDLDGSAVRSVIVVHCDITGRDLGVERTLFDRATGDADYVIASVHDGSFAEGASVSQVTDMYVAALEQEKVFILGHTAARACPTISTRC